LLTLGTNSPKSSSQSKKAFSNAILFAPSATLFDDDWLEEQAQKTGFIVRKRSGLSGCMLLIMNVLELSIHSNHSLQEQCE
jgi:hypothetical protein